MHGFRTLLSFLLCAVATHIALGIYTPITADWPSFLKPIEHPSADFEISMLQQPLLRRTPQVAVF